LPIFVEFGALLLLIEADALAEAAGDSVKLRATVGIWLIVAIVLPSALIVKKLLALFDTVAGTKGCMTKTEALGLLLLVAVVIGVNPMEADNPLLVGLADLV